MKKTLTAVIIGLLVATGVAANAGATKPDPKPPATCVLHIDGFSYTGVNPGGSGTWQFSVPDITTAPVVAYTTGDCGNNTWTGNGSDNLPCPAGTFWVNTPNVLTISHCLDGGGDTTTTTTQPTTTTTEQSTTTTEQATTTTEQVTTTTAEATTTTQAVTTTTPEVSTTTQVAATDPPVPSTTIPTGVIPETGGSVLATFLIAFLITAAGAGLILGVRRPLKR